MRKCLALALAFALNATPGTIYTSTDVPKGLTSLSLTSTLSVPDSVTITDVNLSVNIGAFQASAHSISLTSPGGTTVTVLNGDCAGSAIVATFDDEAGRGLDFCTPGNASALRPRNPLSAFDGQDSNGTWTLTVRSTDSAFADETFLSAWSLDISPNAPVSTVPEPATFGITGLALAGFYAGVRRRRNRRS